LRAFEISFLRAISDLNGVAVFIRNFRRNHGSVKLAISRRSPNDDSGPKLTCRLTGTAQRDGNSTLRRWAPQPNPVSSGH
jgi:hypothetical protein